MKSNHLVIVTSKILWFMHIKLSIETNSPRKIVFSLIFLDLESFTLTLERRYKFWRRDWELFFCSHLARRNQDYHVTILVFRDENKITYCYSNVSRQDWDFRKSFLVVEREKMKLTLVENSRDREFLLTYASSMLCPYRSKKLVQPARKIAQHSFSEIIITEPKQWRAVTNEKLFWISWWGW